VITTVLREPSLTRFSSYFAIIIRVKHHAMNLGCLGGFFAQPGGMSDFPQTWVTEYDLRAGLPTACEHTRESIAPAQVVKKLKYHNRLTPIHLHLLNRTDETEFAGSKFRGKFRRPAEQKAF
jgi:hypothetical protein